MLQKHIVLFNTLIQPTIPYTYTYYNIIQFIELLFCIEIVAHLCSVEGFSSTMFYGSLNVVELVYFKRFLVLLEKHCNNNNNIANLNKIIDESKRFGYHNFKNKLFKKIHFRFCFGKNQKFF